MPARLDVCFLWHMHQPCYHNAATGEAMLPWVRLHATKAYLDMAEALARAPEGVSCVVNFVPVLMDQLAKYGRGEIKDTFLTLSQKAAEKLEVEEKKFILRYFFMANWETMVRPHRRYHDLLVKRGMDEATWDLDRAAERFSADEIRDLQVWFNLAWFGWAAKAKFPVVAKMLAKGGGFSEDDKAAVLKAQQDCINAIVPAWRAVEAAGRAEISATPFYHPILPLVINTRHATRAIPDIALPDDFVAPDDAQAQVDRAVAFHEQTWGRKPAGMWPAEGSVSPEVVPLFRKAGLRWICSDEDVLFHSLQRRNREADLYRPWTAGFGGEEIAMFFRDRTLSDLVGFTYSKMRPEDAAKDFLGRVAEIQKSAHGEKPVAAVILDGENPWEWYPDGGENFLKSLYEGLAANRDVRATTFTRHLEERGERPAPLPALHSGSWINSNYRIWIGHPEDNAGWNLLNRTREDVRPQLPSLDAAAREAVMDNIYRAEGSDWFWWYGDDFHSDNDAEFDLLFRTHLSNAYRAARLEPPGVLMIPISNAGKAMGTKAPHAFISPTIDGNTDSYFEWKGAGYYSVGKSEGAMHKGTAHLVGIHYGFDVENFYFRLDPVAPISPAKANANGKGGQTSDLTVALSLSVIGPGSAASVSEPVEYRVVFPFRQGVKSYSLRGPKAGKRLAEIATSDRVAYDRVIEIAVPLASIGAIAGGNVDFAVRMFAGEVENDRYPRNGTVRVGVPSEDFERVNWWV